MRDPPEMNRSQRQLGWGEPSNQTPEPDTTPQQPRNNPSAKQTGGHPYNQRPQQEGPQLDKGLVLKGWGGVGYGEDNATAAANTSRHSP